MLLKQLAFPILKITANAKIDYLRFTSIVKLLHIQCFGFANVRTCEI